MEGLKGRKAIVTGGTRGIGLAVSQALLAEGVQVAAVYRVVDDKVLMCSITGAEMVKYIDNVWHAAKVTFANEVGRLCKAVEVDSHEVTNILFRTPSSICHPII